MEKHSNILPVFTYGSLQGEGIVKNTGVSAERIGRYATRGLSVGMGDLFPCADITHDINDVTHGEVFELDSIVSNDSLGRLDQYEGVNEGFYERRIIFSNPINNPDLHVPMWVYTRGDKLRQREAKLYSDRLQFQGDLLPVFTRACAFFNLPAPVSHSLIATGFGDYNAKLVMADGSQWVAKVFSKDTNRNMIDRLSFILKSIVDQGINHPEIGYDNDREMIYHDIASDLSMLLMRYVDGIPLVDIETIPPNTYRNIINEAVKISNSHLVVPERFDMWQVTNLEWLLNETKHVLSDEICQKIERIITGYNEILPELPVGFVHGDMTRTNIILTNPDDFNQDIVLLDFGASGMYPRIHELAILAVHCLADGKLSLSECVRQTCDDFIDLGGELSEYELQAIMIYTQAILAAKYLCNVYEIDEETETSEMTYWRNISIIYLMANEHDKYPLQSAQSYQDAYRPSMWLPKPFRVAE